MAIVNVNGINLYYRESGLGEPLLLVHGSGFNADVWDKVVDDLARDYRVIVYDRRAYQRSQGSPPPTANYGYQQGEDIAALLQALNARPANIVGWSAGGIFALHATLSHPDHVKRLVLFEPPLYVMRFLDFLFFKGFIQITLLKAIGKKQAAAESFMHMVLAYQDGRNSYDQISTEFRAKLAADTDTLLAEFTAVAGESLKPDRLSTQIKVPVTFLVGEQSPSTMQRAARNLAGILRDSLIVRLPEANHLAQIDQPGRFVNAVKEALAGR